MLAWDTTLVSRLYPGGALERSLLDHLERDEPIAIAAPTAMEVITGVQATTARDPRLGPVPLSVVRARTG
jgi:hypothetical protein